MLRFLSLLTLGLFAAVARADDWPQWLGPQRDGVWRETGILETFPDEGLPVRWRTPIGGGYSGPVVADGKVVVLDRVGGKDRALCLDASTGRELWKHEHAVKYEVPTPAGPRATPVLGGGKVYTLGAMGDLFCLDAANGAVLWSKNFRSDYKAFVPRFGWGGSPLLDGDKLICFVGGADSLVVAFHKDTGQELWRALKANEPGYSSPLICELGGKRQLIIWHPESVNGLDAETGRVLWSQPFRVSWAVCTPRAAGNRLLVSSLYHGSLMLEFQPDQQAPTVLWQGKSRFSEPDRTDGLHSFLPTPVVKDGFVYGICSYGQLRCLKADTGQRVWESLQLTRTTQGEPARWNNAFLVPQGDRHFFYTEKGDLVIGKLTQQGYEEISRAHILKPDQSAETRNVTWAHPAFANQCIYARNNSEIVCVSLAAPRQSKAR